MTGIFNAVSKKEILNSCTLVTEHAFVSFDFSRSSQTTMPNQALYELGLRQMKNDTQEPSYVREAGVPFWRSLIGRVLRTTESVL